MGRVVELHKSYCMACKQCGFDMFHNFVDHPKKPTAIICECCECGAAFKIKIKYQGVYVVDDE